MFTLKNAAQQIVLFFLRSYPGTALQQSTLVGLSSESRLKNVTANMTGIVLKEAMVVPQTGGVHGGVGISFPIDTDWGEPAAPPAFTMRGDLLQRVNTRNVRFSWETPAADVGVVSQLLLQRATSNQWIVLSEPILPTQNTVTIETSGGEFVLRPLFQDGGFLDSDGDAYSGVVGQSKYWQRILVDTVLFWEISQPSSSVLSLPLSDYKDKTRSENPYYFSYRAQVGTGFVTAIWDGLSLKKTTKMGATCIGIIWKILRVTTRMW